MSDWDAGFDAGRESNQDELERLRMTQGGMEFTAELERLRGWNDALIKTEAKKSRELEHQRDEYNRLEQRLTYELERLRAELKETQAIQKMDEKYGEAMSDKADDALARLHRIEEAARDADTLLTNYLAAGKFPPGSDCEEVRDALRAALEEEA